MSQQQEPDVQYLSTPPTPQPPAGHVRLTAYEVPVIRRRVTAIAEKAVACANKTQWGRELHLKDNQVATKLIAKNMLSTMKHSPHKFNTSNEQLYLQDINNPISTVVAKSYDEAAEELSNKHGKGDQLTSDDFRFMASPEKFLEETARDIRKRKQQDSATKLTDSFQRYLHEAACEVGKELRTTGSPKAAAYLQDEKRRCMAMATAGVRQKFDEEYMQDEEVVILELHDKPAALNPPAPDPNQDAVSGTGGHPGAMAQRQEPDQHDAGVELAPQVAYERQPSTRAQRRSQRTNTVQWSWY